MGKEFNFGVPKPELDALIVEFQHIVTTLQSWRRKLAREEKKKTKKEE